jgi:hypothetical protein
MQAAIGDAHESVTLSYGFRTPLRCTTGGVILARIKKQPAARVGSTGGTRAMASDDMSCVALCDRINTERMRISGQGLTPQLLVAGSGV